MNRVTLLASALAVAFGAVASTAGQGTEQKPQPNRLDLVEVVGCLEEAPNSAWTLTNGTIPVVSNTPFTTEAALKEAETTNLGDQRYRLLGVSLFSPERHEGHKVAVKGLLIKDPKESRVNVTSLQMVAATCTK
jgi:hypothetical protein